MAEGELLLAAETLTPSCRDAKELADCIGALVSKAVGADVTIQSMRLGVGNKNGEEIAINWKRSKK